MIAKLTLLAASVLLFLAADARVAPDVLWTGAGSDGQILNTFDYRDGDLVLTFLPDARRPDTATVFLRLPDGGPAIPARACGREFCFPAADLEVDFDRYSCVGALDFWDDDNPARGAITCRSGDIPIGDPAWISEARWALHDAWLDVGGTSHRLPSFHVE